MIGNRQPPFYTYRAIMIVQPIALNKQPGVRQVGLVENWRLLMEKCVLRVTGQESKATYETEHLDGEFESGIDGGGPFFAPPMGTALTGGGLWVPLH